MSRISISRQWTWASEGVILTDFEGDLKQDLALFLVGLL